MRGWGVAVLVVSGLAGLLWATTLVVPNYFPPAGTINPQVTQANIESTICRREWTATIRPLVAYTGTLKRRQIQERHLPGRPSDYQEDHFIPLELGGHPTSPANLWPQPWWQAQLKDRAEYGLNRAVCAGRITLGQAQRMIRDPGNWHE
jgi:hypothetical protein